MRKSKILHIDDDAAMRELVRTILQEKYEVESCAGALSGLKTHEEQGPFALVLLDINMPDMDGLAVLGKLRALTPSSPVVMVTASGAVKPAVQAMKLGAVDYLTKPLDADELHLTIQRALRERMLEQQVDRLVLEVQTTHQFENMIGRSAAMQKVYAMMQRLLTTDTTVLILGETGTGKELVARAMHYHGPRKAGPFIAVHCAAIPADLLESELFGHEKGSFTGAIQRRIGMFEAVEGGTLFLDELGEMPLGAQTKLLRALQEREIRRVGSLETIHINVRLVCATNRNLEAEVAKGTFREDLYYRINVVPVVLPPLRERKEDIAHLILHFTSLHAKKLAREAPVFTAEAMEKLTNYAWPGNVRELEHTVERTLITCDARRIHTEDLSFLEARLTEPTVALAEEPTIRSTGNLDMPKMVEDFERRLIEEAMRRSGGKVAAAAHLLNVTRRVLSYKMTSYNIKIEGEENSGNDSDR